MICRVSSRVLDPMSRVIRLFDRPVGKDTAEAVLTISLDRVVGIALTRVTDSLVEKPDNHLNYFGCCDQSE
jgi:hypothetical protein